MGWREPAEPTQIGQLMYYLTAVQFTRLQRQHSSPPTPVLGLYMEDGLVCGSNLVSCSTLPLFLSQMAPVVAQFVESESDADTECDWKLLIMMEDLLHFSEGGLPRGIRLAQRFMSSTLY